MSGEENNLYNDLLYKLGHFLRKAYVVKAVTESESFYMLVDYNREDTEIRPKMFMVTGLGSMLYIQEVMSLPSYLATVDNKLPRFKYIRNFFRLEEVCKYLIPKLQEGQMQYVLDKLTFIEGVLKSEIRKYEQRY